MPSRPPEPRAISARVERSAESRCAMSGAAARARSRNAARRSIRLRSMADVIEFTYDVVHRIRLRAEPGDDRFAIRVRCLKAIAGDDVGARDLAIHQQQAAHFE